MRPGCMMLAAIGLATAGTAQASPVLDGILGDHAVIQRGQPLVLAGSAAPGERVIATVGSASAQARADRDGRFRLTLPPLVAGGPYTLTLSAPSGRSVLTDLLVGDVYLCSGQSNMELQVERAQDSYNQTLASADDQLRLVTVAKHTAPAPLARFTEQPLWAAATPATVPGFSAACFYMAQELRRADKVPVGAIDDSWGGTAISAWMGDAAQRAAGRADQADLLQLYARDPAAATLAFGHAWEGWWRRTGRDAPGHEPWQPDAALAWKPVPRIGGFQQWGVPALADYVGMVWYRRDVTLTAAQAAPGAHLTLGRLDDVGQSWVNGQPVGSSGNPGTAQDYALAPGVLRPGRNVIVVNVNNVYADGGMLGPAGALGLSLADGTSIALATGWQYAIAGKPRSDPPRAPWDDIAGTGTIYNAMMAPLGPVGLAGVAWYQGESDTGIDDYGRRLAAMIAEWRGQVSRPALPFAIVSLSGYGTPPIAPSDSGWARLREAQRKTAKADPHAALAITIDLGDPLDIHPGEKHEVGRRLARAMRALHGASISPSGPRARAAASDGAGGVTVTFADVQGGLHTRSSGGAIAFELCGAAPASCRYAPAVASGSTVRIAGDGKPVTRIRYAWADAPSVNLFDEAPLPAGPFELPVR